MRLASIEIQIVASPLFAIHKRIERIALLCATEREVFSYAAPVAVSAPCGSAIAARCRMSSSACQSAISAGFG